MYGVLSGTSGRGRGGLEDAKHTKFSEFSMQFDVMEIVWINKRGSLNGLRRYKVV